LKEWYALPEARERLATFMRLRERYLLFIRKHKIDEKEAT